LPAARGARFDSQACGAVLAFSESSLYDAFIWETTFPNFCSQNAPPLAAGPRVLILHFGTLVSRSGKASFLKLSCIFVS
jgi:hypothetical protein